MASNQALLIIDVQNGMFLESTTVFQGEALLSKLQDLIDKARSTDTPVVYVQHQADEGPLVQGTEGWLIHPSIQPQEQDLIIHKRTPDSFHETTLKQELDRRGINEVILTGIQTDLCVDTTCRRASCLGYKVTLVKDAHSTWNTEELTATQVINHHNYLLQFFGNVLHSDEVQFES